MGGSGSHQVILKSGPKKPKLENVSLAQWTIANLAILYRLILGSRLSFQTVNKKLSLRVTTLPRQMCYQEFHREQS